MERNSTDAAVSRRDLDGDVSARLPDVPSVNIRFNAPQDKAELRQLCDALTDVGMTVRESKWQSPHTVLFFTELHSVEDALETYRRLQFCGTRMNFDFLFLEGWAGHPDSLEHRGARKKYLDLCHLPEPQPPRITSQGTVRGLETAMHVSWSFFSEEFKRLEGMGNVRVVGVEQDTHLLIRSKAIVGVLQMLQSLSGQLDAGQPMVLSRADRVAPYYLAIIDTLTFLGGFDSDLKKLKLGNFTFVRNSDEIVIERKHRPLIESLTRKLNRLLGEEHPARHQVVSDVMKREVSHCDLSISGMVFGLAHSVSLNRNRDVSLQRYLLDAGYSYLVIDRYSNAVEMVGGLV